MTDSANSYRYYYSLGEISYFLKNYPESLGHYMNAFKLTPSDNLKYKIKILDAMLGVLALQEINEKNQDIHLFVYSNYIELLPKDQKTRLIYPKSLIFPL
jgi:tetratricopeptide (TPR) repeat protein